MNALIGKVQVLPVQTDGVTVWYSPAGFEGVVSTDAQLQDGDGDLLMVYRLGRLSIISVAQVNRVTTDRRAESVEISEIENADYSTGYRYE